MSTMSYALFENILQDMRDCREVLDEVNGDLSAFNTKKKLDILMFIKMCKRISEEHGDLR